MILSKEKIILLILISSVSMITGIILVLLKHPYNGVLSTIHKLLSVIFIVLVFVFTMPVLKEMNVSLVIWIFLFLFSLSSIISVASGAILLGLQEVNKPLQITHRIVPFLVYLFSFIYTFFLFKR